MMSRYVGTFSAYLLGFLLVFAALSSAHVVREGLKSPTASGFRLLVQVMWIACVMLRGIVTDDVA